MGYKPLMEKEEIRIKLPSRETVTYVTSTAGYNMQFTVDKKYDPTRKRGTEFFAGGPFLASQANAWLKGDSDIRVFDKETGAEIRAKTPTGTYTKAAKEFAHELQKKLDYGAEGYGVAMVTKK